MYWGIKRGTLLRRVLFFFCVRAVRSTADRRSTSVDAVRSTADRRSTVRSNVVAF